MIRDIDDDDNELHDNDDDDDDDMGGGPGENDGDRTTMISSKRRRKSTVSSSSNSTVSSSGSSSILTSMAQKLDALPLLPIEANKEPNLESSSGNAVADFPNSSLTCEKLKNGVLSAGLAVFDDDDDYDDCLASPSSVVDRQISINFNDVLSTATTTCCSEFRAPPPPLPSGAPAVNCCQNNNSISLYVKPLKIVVDRSIDEEETAETTTYEEDEDYCSSSGPVVLDDQNLLSAKNNNNANNLTVNNNHKSQRSRSVFDSATNSQLVKALKLRLTTDQHLLRIPNLRIVDKLALVTRRSRTASQAQWKNSKPGVYLNDGVRQVDFVLVYELPADGQIVSGDALDDLTKQRRYFEKNLRREGLVLEMDPVETRKFSTGLAASAAVNRQQPPSPPTPAPAAAAPTSAAPRLCFVKVHVTWEALCRGAEMLQMRMPLRYNTRYGDSLSSFTRQSTISLKKYYWPPPFLARFFRLSPDEDALVDEITPQRVTAQFNMARLDQFLVENQETFFSSAQRIRVVYDIMQQTKCDPKNSKKRGLQWLLKHRVYTGAYPPHDGNANVRHLDVKEKSLWSQRQILRLTWANFKRAFKFQPLNLVRQYFGEKVALYFAWLGFYTQMLIFPSIVGIVSFLYGIFSLPNNPIRNQICNNSTAPGNFTMCPVCRVPNCDPWIMAEYCDSAEWNYRFDHESHVFVAMFTLLWATVFVQLWKRRECELACEWNCFNSQQDDGGLRPEFEARTRHHRISLVSNEEEPYVSKWRRGFWLAQSLSGMLFLILIVIAALVGLIAVRILIYKLLKDFDGFWRQKQFELASLAIHVLTFLVVMTLGWIYEKIAHRLTEVECPRTQNDYLTSYIWKVFIFELLNNFAPIFYAALLRGRILIEPSQQSYLQEMCDPGGCLNEVVQAISILLLARLLISNLAEIGFPHLKSIWKDMRLTTGGLVVPDNALTDDPNYVTHVPWWHKDYVLNDPKLDGVYAEFLEMMVQFGYVTLFVAAFPLAPLICLLNNLVEIRLDAINFVTAFRRPLPVRVPGILIWRRCLNIIIKLAVLCNGGFLAMTSEIIPQMIYRYFYSADKSLNGYVEFFLSKYNVSDWPDFQREYPGVEYCYFRDFKAYKIVWWQIMVARLTFFTLFILFFYFFQWVCEFLINDLPESVKMQLEKEKFLQRQTFYGREIKIDPSSATPTRRPSRITQDEFSFFNNDNRILVESKTVVDNQDQQQQNDPTVVCDLRCYSVSDLLNRNNGRYFRRDDRTNSNV